MTCLAPQFKSPSSSYAMHNSGPLSSFLSPVKSSATSVYALQLRCLLNCLNDMWCILRKMLSSHLH
ncbi:unnamed protein product [Musa acuminata subsp. burmannicoides]